MDYFIYNPNGNITAIAASPVAARKQPQVACAIMEKEPACEQVGFLNGSRLRMAGGEFCGNAAACAAYHIARSEGVRSFDIEVSGAATPIAATVEGCGNDRAEVSVCMPQAVNAIELRLSYGSRSVAGTVVDLGGIVHFVTEEALDTDFAEAAVIKWCRERNAPAFGIMQYSRETSELKPLVYVPAANTLFWENSCASGSTAAFLYANRKYGTKELALGQPGGMLQLSTDNCGNVRLSETVYFMKQGQI